MTLLTRNHRKGTRAGQYPSQYRVLLHCQNQSLSHAPSPPLDTDVGALVHGLLYATGVTTIHLIVQGIIMDTEVITTGDITEGAIMTILGFDMEEIGIIIIAGEV